MILKIIQDFIKSFYTEPRCCSCGIGPDIYDNFLVKIEHKGKFNSLVMCLNCFQLKFMKHYIHRS